MNRFNNDDDDDDEGFFSDMEENDDDEHEHVEDIDKETLEYLERREGIDIAQLDLIQLGLNQKLLNKVLETLQKTWFWNFRSQQTKLKMINELYHYFYAVVHQKFEEEE